MKKGQFENLQDRFYGYIGRFYGNGEFVDANIKLKEDHTERVCDEMRFLRRELGLDGEKGYLADAMALVHDAGRFEQFKQYKTYNDKDSINHSRFGVTVPEK